MGAFCFNLGLGLSHGLASIRKAINENNDLRPTPRYRIRCLRTGSYTNTHPAPHRTNANRHSTDPDSHLAGFGC